MNYFLCLGILLFLGIGNSYCSDTTIVRHISLAKTDTLSAKVIQQVLQESIHPLVTRGYPFAEATITDMAKNKDDIILFISVTSHQFIQIDTLIVYGNAAISPSFLSSFLDIKKGDMYNHTLVTQIDKKLQQIEFIKILKPTEVHFTVTGCQIRLFIAKENSHIVDGLIGFYSDPKTNKIQSTGQANLQLKNALKRGEYMGFLWDKTAPLSQTMDIQFSYPYLFQTPFAIEANFKLDKKDSTYLTLVKKIGINYLWHTHHNIQGYIQTWKSSTIQSESVALEWANVNTTYYGMHYIGSWLDKPFMPKKGIQWSWDNAIGDKKGLPGVIASSKGVPYKTEEQLDIYIPLHPRIILYMNQQGGFLHSKLLAKNELFTIGGHYSLRGFDPKSIYTKAYMMYLLETRFYIDQRSFLALFYNQAIYQPYQKMTYQYPFGIGVGLTTQIKTGYLSLSYALGKQPQQTLLFREAKFHLTYINKF